MVRYVRQRNESGCGPVAILNTMKWANPDQSFTYEKLYPHLAEMCQTDQHGTAEVPFMSALYTMGEYRGNFNAIKLCNFELRKLTGHVYSGGAVILGHHELPQKGVNDPEGHYSLWVPHGEEPLKMVGVNAHRAPKPTVSEPFSLDYFRTINQITEDYYQDVKMEIYLITKGKL